MTDTSRRLALGLVVAGFVSARPADAFYFEGWPGSGTPTPLQFTSPGSTPDPLGFNQTQATSRQTVIEPVPPEIPEPAAVVLAGCGLIAVAVTRRRGPAGS